MFGNLEGYEQKVYSQCGEDGILTRIFEVLGTTNKFFVEFGVGSTAEQCNTRHLAAQGWQGLLMDICASPDHPEIRRERVTAENINDLFAKYGVPEQPDLLSIDIDGNDYWVWKAIDARYQPRAVVIEYNAMVPPTESKTIAYEPDFRWSGTDYFGASLLALQRLGRRKGYCLVGCNKNGVNAFFVRKDLFQGPEPDIGSVYRRLTNHRRFLAPYIPVRLLRACWIRWMPELTRGYPRDRRRMIDVE